MTSFSVSSCWMLSLNEYSDRVYSRLYYKHFDGLEHAIQATSISSREE